MSVTQQFRRGVLTTLFAQTLQSVRVRDCRDASVPFVAIEATDGTTQASLYLTPEQAIEMLHQLAALFDGEVSPGIRQPAEQIDLAAFAKETAIAGLRAATENVQ